jgi:hypothetical protein
MSHRDAPPRLVELAPELLELVLALLGPQDLTRFGATCRRAHDFIRPTNQLLWKQTFLHRFDHPKHVWHALVPTARARNQPREALWDWHTELVRRTKAGNLLLDANRDTLALHVDHVVGALLDIQHTASCPHTPEPDAPDAPDAPVSLNIIYLNRLAQHVPDFDAIIHDFSRHPSSLAVPRNLKMDLDRPITRSMLRSGAVAPDWASQFHVRGPLSDPYVACVDDLSDHLRPDRKGAGLDGIQGRRKSYRVRLERNR